MAEASPPAPLSPLAVELDPEFEPQSRPRSCTWPLQRPELQPSPAKPPGEPPADAASMIPEEDDDDEEGGASAMAVGGGEEEAAAAQAGSSSGACGFPRGKKQPRGREGRTGGAGHLPPATRRKSAARVVEEAASLHVLWSNALYTSSHGTLKGLKDTFVTNQCTISLSLSLSVDVEAGTSSLHCGAMLFLLPLDGGEVPAPRWRVQTMISYGKGITGTAGGGLLCEKQKLKLALV